MTRFEPKISHFLFRLSGVYSEIELLLTISRSGNGRDMNSYRVVLNTSTWHVSSNAYGMLVPAFLYACEML